MAIERFYEQVGPISFTADGQENGVITVSDTEYFKVKMFVVLKSDTVEEKRFEIKRVISPTQMILGPEKQSIKLRSDVRAYTLVDNATVTAPYQEKNQIPQDDINQAVYDREPTVAYRNVMVDRYGDYYEFTNPVPVSDVGFTEEERIKNTLMCAVDLEKSMTWNEIDGVRRVVEIVFTSLIANQTFDSTITLTRTFTYQTSDPFDLIEIKDKLGVV